MALSDGRASEWLHCECTNCTHRWSEPKVGFGTIRCPVEDCGSKNVEIQGGDDD